MAPIRSVHDDIPSPSVPERRHRIGALFWCKLLLAAIIFVVLYKSGLLDASALFILLRSPWLLAIAILLLGGTLMLTALRWQILLRTQEIRLSYRDVFRVNYACALLGAYLPGSVGGDVARAVFGASLPPAQISAFVLSVAADRLLGLFALLIVGFVASLMYLANLDSQVVGYTELRSLVFLVGGVVVVIAGMVLTVGFLGQRVRVDSPEHGGLERGFLVRFIADALASVRVYFNHPGSLLLALGVSLLIHAMGLAALVLITRGVISGGAEMSNLAMVGAIASIVNYIPLTPGGLGVGEMTFAQLMLWLEPMSHPPPYASAFLVYRSVVVLTLVPALLMPPKRFRLS